MWYRLDVNNQNLTRSEEIDKELRREGFEVIFNRRASRIWITSDSKYAITMLNLKFSDCEITSYDSITDALWADI